MKSETSPEEAVLRQKFEEMKRFVGFGPEDVANLAALAPLAAQYGPKITDEFYETLGEFEATRAHIDGQVDRLKRTHAQWMKELFAGDYGDAYFDSRIRIGQAHVRIELPPEYVEGVMNHLRVKFLAAAAQALSAEELQQRIPSLYKILDLDLVLINLAYSEDRIDRISRFTGMRRRLLENMVRYGGKSK